MLEYATLEETFSRYASEEVLFAPRVSRLELTALRLEFGTARQVAINVWRNHALEPLIPLVRPYAAYGGWEPKFQIGPYDDSLSFVGWQRADVELIWLDRSRFSREGDQLEWLTWIEGRIRTLRAKTTAPVIVATWSYDGAESVALGSIADRLPETHFADLGLICNSLDVPLLDSRSTALAGTPVSRAAQLALARELASHWLPAALLPPIKAITLDLDNTLHDGVLGEDGIHGVRLTAGHVFLQQYVKSLRQRGVFIALVSKNELQDVQALFSRRDDFPLRWDDFSAVDVSWGSKAEALKRVARTLRISTDAMLFVDDNPGELASIAVQLPGIHTAQAHADASLTQRVVRYFPGLWRWKAEADDAKRIDDLKANEEREALAKNATDPAEYFRSLQASLCYRNNPLEQLTRLADLCAKTNQFNLSLRRFNQVELAERMRREDACVASVHLTDRLSDSGVIAVLVAERRGDQLVVEDLCISCRALGRQLEDIIVIAGLRNMPIFPGCQQVAFHLQHGSRNQPAVTWLGRLVSGGVMLAPGLHTIPAQCLTEFAVAEGVTVELG